MESKQAVIEELLGNTVSDVSKFSIDLILNSSTTTEDLRANHCFLTQIGVTNKKIASQAHLLGRDSGTIKTNYAALQKLGLTNDKIASHAELLGRNPNTIKTNYQILQKLFEPEKIVTYASLLGTKPQTVEDNVKFLKKIGVDYHVQPLLLGTSVRKKKNKLIQFFKIIFCEEVPEETLEQRARTFYANHNNPHTITKTLVRSTAYVQHNKKIIRKYYNPAVL